MNLDVSKAHRAAAGSPTVRVAVFTLSDTRSEADDRSGALMKELLSEAGHVVVRYAVMKDEPAALRAEVEALAASRLAQAILTNGGTGVAKRDSTYEALAGLLEKRLDGFGELFRMLSYHEVGPAAMLSRAAAGVYRGLALFSIPGSPHAVRLAMEKLILPELPHLIRELEK